MTDIRVLNDWMDQHHITVVRTHATTLDGVGIGKHLNRKKFIAYLPQGHGVADMAFTMDRTGSPHKTMWHHEREPNLGDIYLRPDTDTLTYDAADPDLGHCIADLTNAEGKPLELCPRSTLKRIVAKMAERDLYAKCTFELEFFLFDESFNDLRACKYQRKTPISALQDGPGIYNIRNSYLVKPFMKELIRRIEWQGIEWESWNDENGAGQIELNLSPLAPVQMADTMTRIKQMVYEVSCDLGHAATFMASLGGGFSNGLHIHHSLANDQGESVFHDEANESRRSELMDRWLAGIVQTLPGSVSLLCPSINSYRRFKNFTAVPMTKTWEQDNKSTAVRVLGSSANSTRIEHRLAAGDANPYLALAVQFAGGLAGLDTEPELETEHTGLAWGLPPSNADLPVTIRDAAATTRTDALLRSQLGEGFVDYWAQTRDLEWLQFHTEGGDPASREATLWEYQRYFEHA
jgi:glutamine synthetase